MMDWALRIGLSVATGLTTSAAVAQAGIIDEQLLGPTAALVGAIALIGLFLTERLVPGARALRAEKSRDDGLLLIRDLADAFDKMGDALAERNRIDAEAQRLEGERIRLERDKMEQASRRRRTATGGI